VLCSRQGDHPPPLPDSLLNLTCQSIPECIPRVGSSWAVELVSRHERLHAKIDLVFDKVGGGGGQVGMVHEGTIKKIHSQRAAWALRCLTDELISDLESSCGRTRHRCLLDVAARLEILPPSEAPHTRSEYGEEGNRAPADGRLPKPPSSWPHGPDQPTSELLTRGAFRKLLHELRLLPLVHGRDVVV